MFPGRGIRGLRHHRQNRRAFERYFHEDEDSWGGGSDLKVE
jgi:hypothetical protein